MPEEKVKTRKLYLDPIAEMAKDAKNAENRGTCICGVALSRENSAKLPSGVVQHIGCKGPVEADGPTPFEMLAADVAVAIQTGSTTVPVDAPREVVRIPLDEDEREGTPYTAATVPVVVVAAPVLPPTTLPPSAAPAAVPVATLPSTKAPKAPRTPKVKAPTIGWYASVGVGRWGPFTGQLEAYEGMTLPAALAGTVAAELAAGRPASYGGMPLVNVGAAGVPKWMPLGLVVYPERL